MRTATAPELAILAATTRQITYRVKVKNGSGTWIDLSTWVESFTPDTDIDQPVSGCTITFRRDSGTTLSLAPLRTDSTLNRLDDGTTYSPQLDAGRSITVEPATTAVGVAPIAADYKKLFEGTIDTVNSERSPVFIVCRDLGAQIVDRWIETEPNYGSAGGIAVETVMQSVLDDNFGVGFIPLYTPVSPSYLILPAYQQQRQSVMDAEQALSQLPGWDVRYKWDGGTSAFRFTLYNPPRTNTTPDHTFGPSAYIDVTALELDITDVRNVITVSYPTLSIPARATLTVSDSASITKYGRRFLFIQEADTSPINTSGEATILANAALSDLKDPKATFEVELPFFWPAELHDLYRFSANAVHFNTNQDLAVVSIRHELSRGRHRTHLKLRGKPAGGYLTWLTREGIAGGVAGATRPPIVFVYPTNGETDSLFQLLTFDASAGSGGGGINLAYAVYQKLDFAAETTLYTGDGSTLPRAVSITRHPRSEKNLRYRATDTATGLFDETTWTIPSARPEINDAGYSALDNSPVAGNRTAQRAGGGGPPAVEEEGQRGGAGGYGAPGSRYRAEPYMDSTGSIPLVNPTTREILSGLEIGSGVKGKADVVFGTTVRYPVSRHNENIYGVHTDSKSFASSYESIPQIRVLGDTWTLPSTGEGSARKVEMKAINLTVSGFDVRAVSSTGSSSAAQSEDPATTLNGTPQASVLLDTDLEPAYWNLANANTTLTTYTAHYDAETSGDSGAGTMVVRLYKNDGTGSTNWTEVASRSYTSGHTWNNEQLSFDATMAVNWDIRIIMDKPLGGGWLNTTVTAEACTYNKITAGTETSLTSPAGSQLLVQAMEQV